MNARAYSMPMRVVRRHSPRAPPVRPPSPSARQVKARERQRIHPRLRAYKSFAEGIVAMHPKGVRREMKGTFPSTSDPTSAFLLIRYSPVAQ